MWSLPSIPKTVKPLIFSLTLDAALLWHSQLNNCHRQFPVKIKHLQPIKNVPRHLSICKAGGRNNAAEGCLRSIWLHIRWQTLYKILTFIAVFMPSAWYKEEVVTFLREKCDYIVPVVPCSPSSMQFSNSSFFWSFHNLIIQIFINVRTYNWYCWVYGIIYTLGWFGEKKMICARRRFF